MKIIFILDHVLMHYRVPLFTKLSELGYNVTVVHSGTFINDCNFNQLIVKECKIFKFKYKVLNNLNRYDVVIQMQNLYYLNTWTNTFNPFKKYKLIDWTIGTSTKNGLSEHISKSDKLRNFLSSFVDQIILYSDFGKFKYSKANQKKIICAHNTILNPIEENLSNFKKDSFLFIGNLSKRKGLNELIEAFYAYSQINSNQDIKYLQIIGTGNEEDRLIKMVEELGLSKRVIFYGQINDFDKKREIFSRSIVNISPNQAGLSVLESFSFGVPFISKYNAISGGEHLNIINDYTGYLYKSEDELVDLMTYISNNTIKLQEIGSKAFEYYQEKRNYDLFVKSFIEAIQKSKK